MSSTNAMPCLFLKLPFSWIWIRLQGTLTNWFGEVAGKRLALPKLPNMNVEEDMAKARKIPRGKGKIAGMANSSKHNQRGEEAVGIQRGGAALNIDQPEM